MTTPEAQPDAPTPRRFQFSLATLIVFVTGVCVALSLLRWHWTFGLMAAILLVVSGWSFAAMRAKYHRLAYTLATPAMGVAGHLVLVVPMALILRNSLWDLWFRPAAILLMSVSTMLAAAVMRRRILGPGPKVRTGIAVAVTYVTAAIFPFVWGAAVLFMEPVVGMLIAFIGLFLSPFVATVTLPVSLPLAVVCCAILRKVDPWRSKANGPVTMDLHRTMRSRRRAADMRLSGEYANLEEVLAAAFRLDMDGKWHEAVAIYVEVARRWPEHKQYALERIRQVEEKRSRVAEP